MQNEKVALKVAKKREGVLRLKTFGMTFYCQKVKIDYRFKSVLGHKKSLVDSLY